MLSLRRWFRRTPLLYTAYVKLTGKYNPDIMPVAGVDLFVTSNGRSGTTFATYLIKQCFQGLRIVSHAHNVATLKLALRNRIRTIVTVRNPLETVASSVVKFRATDSRTEQAKMDEAVVEWNDYYDFVLQHSGDFCIMEFRDCIDRPAMLIEAVQAMGYRLTDRRPLEAVLEDVRNGLARDNVEKQLSESQSNLPNETKERKKRECETRIRSHRDFERADAIYQALSARKFQLVSGAAAEDFGEVG